MLVTGKEMPEFLFDYFVLPPMHTENHAHMLLEMYIDITQSSYLCTVNALKHQNHVCLFYAFGNGGKCAVLFELLGKYNDVLV